MTHPRFPPKGWVAVVVVAAAVAAATVVTDCRFQLQG